MNFADVLPGELSEQIFVTLSVNDICASSAVCSQWRIVCNTDRIWQNKCRKMGWTKYAYGALDLTHLPSSDKILSRTNVSGTSPKFEYFEVTESLQPIPRWRIIYMKAKFLESNWVKGHYNVLPTLRTHESRVSAFDSNGMVLVSGSTDHIAIWDLDNMVARYKIAIHNDQVNHIQLQGHIAAVSFAEGAIKVYDTISGRLVMTFHGRCAAEHLRFINKELIVCSYSDKALRVWSLRDKCLKFTIFGHREEIECLIVRKDLCVTGGWDGMLILWDVVKGEMIYAMQGNEDSVMCCDMDDDYIVSGNGDGAVRVWKILTADCIEVLDGGISEVYCVKITPTLIAASGSASLVVLWSREDFSLLHTLKRHLGIVRTLKFNGDLLVSGGDGKMICVWCSKTGKLHNIVHRNPNLLHLMWVNETKIITASPNAPGSITVLSYW